jgi:DNA-binding transcriptional ArsR family regulator
MITGVPRLAMTADVYNALGEERRRDILDVLHDGEAAVGEIVTRLGLAQPQVSKHLRVLREVDLVRCRTVGRHRLYRVNAPALRPVHDWVSRYERLWNERYDRLDAYLHELRTGAGGPPLPAGSRPAPHLPEESAPCAPASAPPTSPSRPTSRS